MRLFKNFYLGVRTQMCKGYDPWGGGQGLIGKISQFLVEGLEQTLALSHG